MRKYGIHNQSSTLCDFSRNYIRSNDLFQKTVLCIIFYDYSNSEFIIYVGSTLGIQELNSKQYIQILFIPNPTPFCLPIRIIFFVEDNYFEQAILKCMK